MSVRVAINGFGRIGRNVLRAIIEAGRKDIEVVALNDLAPVETNAHLLRFDSIHGRFPGEVVVSGDSIDCGAGPIKVTAIKNPAELPWKALGIDIALECTGIFTSKEKAKAHLDAGAKRVLVSAPADNADLTVVYGVNHDKLTREHLVVSNASCTTNCLAPLAKVMNDAVGIEKGFMTTVHAYTNDQPSQDQFHKDLYRGAGGGAVDDPDLHRCRQGGRPRAAGTQRQARRRVDPGADPERVGGRSQIRRQAHHHQGRDQRRRAARRRAAAQGHSRRLPTSPTSRSTSTTIPARRSSTWTRPRSSTAIWCG